MEVMFSRSLKCVSIIRPLPVLTTNISTSVRWLYCMKYRIHNFKNFENNSLCIISLRNCLLFQNHNFICQRLINKYGSVVTYSSDSGKCNEDLDKLSGQKKVSLFQKMKQMTKDYWHILIPVHVVTSLGWVAIFYAAAKNGVDIVSIMEYLHLSERYLEILRNSNAGNWAITYALYKLFTPARYTVTIGATTVAIRYLSRLGYIKKPSFKVTPTNRNKAVQSQNSTDKSDFKAERQTEPPKT